jgi:hypothetical protein
MSDTRILKIESEEDLGQFVDKSVEAQLSGDDSDVRVEEVDPNMIPSGLLE